MDISSADKGETLDRKIRGRSESLVFLISGKIAHALAATINKSLKDGHDIDDAIATFHSHRRTSTPI